MEFFKQLLMIESVKAANKETDHAITIINKVYNEWKKIKRRINAIDIITTSVNKVSKINPSILDHMHAAAKAKLVIIIMRCMDNPVWKPLDAKEKTYKKLYPLIQELQNEHPNVGTTGSLKEIIMTRMSAALSYQLSRGDVFVAYEPTISKDYLQFLFGNTTPIKTYRMQALNLPEEFETLIDTLKINHEKAMTKVHPDIGVHKNN